MPSGLLGAIQRARRSKEVESAPRPEPPRTSLPSIKSGGTLRKVVREQKPRPARRSRSAAGHTMGAGSHGRTPPSLKHGEATGAPVWALRRLMDAEVVDDARLDGVAISAEAEARLRTADTGGSRGPDVRVFVMARRAARGWRAAAARVSGAEGPPPRSSGSKPQAAARTPATTALSTSAPGQIVPRQPSGTRKHSTRRSPPPFRGANPRASVHRNGYFRRGWHRSQCWQEASQLRPRPNADTRGRGSKGLGASAGSSCVLR